MSTPKASRNKNIATAIRWLGTIISTGLFIWLISRQNWQVVLAKVAGISFWVLLLAVIMYCISYAFNTLRWCILLWTQEVKISFWQAFRIAWAGNFASNFLPSTIGGDGLRLVGIFRYTDRKTVAIGSLILDRIINMTAWVCLLPAPILLFGSSLGRFFSGAAFVIPGGPGKLFERYAPKIVSAVRAWASHPWAFVYAFLAAWPSNLIPMAATYLIAHQLGMSVSFWQVISVQTVSYFLSQLPISVNGIGLREGVYTTLYTALGATLEQASTLALVTRFLILLATVPGAFWLSGSVTEAALSEEM